MIYPQKLNSKKSAKIIYSLLSFSIIFAILIITINRLTTPNIHWAAFVNLGIIYTWIVVLFSIKRGINLAGHILLQTIAISAIIIYIDYKIGFKGWSINLGFPIILIVANITMLILTIISYKKYIKYAIYQLFIVGISFLPILLILEGKITNNLLNQIAIIVSISNLVISLSLSYKDIKDAIIRNFHM